MNDKRLRLSDIPAFSQAVQSAGRRLVVTNGHFDLLHVGHVRYLQAARDLGDVLLVGVNGDAASRALKGPHRPLVPADERAELLAALACVDAVCIFEALTAVELVRLAHPHIYVKGGDYRDDDGGYSRLPEAVPVVEGGGRVVLLPFTEGHSTSELIVRVVTRYGGSLAAQAET